MKQEIEWQWSEKQKSELIMCRLVDMRVGAAWKKVWRLLSLVEQRPGQQFDKLVDLIDKVGLNGDGH